MDHVLILLVTVAAVTHVAGGKCSQTQNQYLCTVTPGGSVYIQVVTNASSHQVWCQKKLPSGLIKFLTVKKDKVSISEEYRKRTGFFINNGTFMITDVTRNDSGQYILEAFDPNGVQVRNITVQLDVEEHAFPILITVSAGVGGLLLMILFFVVVCCVCKCRKKSGAKKKKENKHLHCELGPCVETSCDGRQDGAQCYGALGGTVVLQLMDSASGIFKYQWKSKTTIILIWKENKLVHNLIENRSIFTPSNGTFRINNLSRTDSGEYKLEIHDAAGQTLEQRTLQLSFQAPVSSVRLVPECLSLGKIRVSCSSEGGDSPQYSWTLNGHTLTDAELLSGNSETNSITLKPNISGRLNCSVRNHVSSVSKEEVISTCDFINCTLTNGTQISQWEFADTNIKCIAPTTAPIPTTPDKSKETDTTVSKILATNISSSTHTVTTPSNDHPWYIKYLAIMGGVLSALVILLVVGVGVIYAQKKNKNNKAKEKADEQELTYADVRVVQRQGRKVQQRPQEEVEYGQVKFSRQSRQIAEPAGDDCVYAKVRKGT
ncbi:uncharacterized protein LOC121188949 [Toxotes jaculatrix]|uniref:uncharacterized protein LOC121188949 n=1 Tax=Toxotes jaculatrix TaxID=941984 RepID=UPI001B3B0045|nr:uncharacterized protein LOC121188949 [Toxotes jaculatrix]